MKRRSSRFSHNLYTDRSATIRKPGGHRHYHHTTALSVVDQSDDINIEPANLVQQPDKKKKKHQRMVFEEEIDLDMIAFSWFDLSGVGSFTFAQFKRAAKELDLESRIQVSLEAMFKAANTSKSGRVSFAEFSAASSSSLEEIAQNFTALYEKECPFSPQLDTPRSFESEVGDDDDEQRLATVPPSPPSRPISRRSLQDPPSTSLAMFVESTHPEATDK